MPMTEGNIIESEPARRVVTDRETIFIDREAHVDHGTVRDADSRAFRRRIADPTCRVDTRMSGECRTGVEGNAWSHFDGRGTAEDVDVGSSFP